jgi:hypothetical protein
MNRFSTQNILTCGILSLSLALTGCLTDDGGDDDDDGGAQLVTTKNVTAGAQDNNAGSSIDIDVFVAYTATVAKTMTEKIDLIFANSTATGSGSVAIYSPHAAKDGIDGSAGFDFMQTGWATANNTTIKTVNDVNLAFITKKSQIDSLWSAGSTDADGRVYISTGDVFLAKSNEGRTVLVRVNSVTTGNNGTAQMTGVAMF